MSPTEERGAQILKAAQRLFVERGFAGTSMSAIAREAGVTQSLIHYHYSSKQELWIAVKRSLFERYEAEQSALFDAQGERDDPEQLRDAVGLYFRFLAENPAFVRLAAWAGLERDIAAAEQCSHLGQELMARGAEKIARAQERGLIRPDVPGPHMIITFLSAAIEWFQSSAEYLELFPDMTPEEASRAYLASLQRIFMEGILPR